MEIAFLIKVKNNKFKMEIMEILTNNNEQLQYDNAVKRVKKIKGFYIHFLIYCIINCYIIYFNIQNLEPGENYFQIKNFITALCWGIGLASHGLSIFGPNIFFGKDWEEKKIKQYMEKDKQQTKNWN